MSNTAIENNSSLKEVLNNQIRSYMSQMKEQKITNLYDMLLEQIEIPVLEATIKHCKYNQVQTAKVLGLSRNTLRAKLRKHFGDKYCSTREK